MTCPRPGCGGKAVCIDRERVPFLRADSNGLVEVTRVYRCDCGKVFHASRQETPWAIDESKTKPFVRTSAGYREAAGARKYGG